MMKFHLGVVLFFTFRLVVIAQPQCFDVPGWEDTDGDDCKWYSKSVGIESFYDENASRCNLFGSCCALDGHTAETACCECGGGIMSQEHPSISPAFTLQPSSVLQTGCVDIKGWSNEGYDCPWFSEDVGDDTDEYDDASTRCSEYGTWNNIADISASDACCVCGGGVRSTATPSVTPSVTPKQCFDAPGWIDSEDRNCTWYAIHDNDPRCENFGHLFTNNGFVANDACCICGGGSVPSALPSKAPSASPSAQPSGKPSSSPFAQPSGKPSAKPQVAPTQPPVDQIGKLADESGASSIFSSVGIQVVGIVLMAGPLYMFL